MECQQPEGLQSTYPHLRVQSVGADEASPEYEAWGELGPEEVPKNKTIMKDAVQQNTREDTVKVD